MRSIYRGHEHGVTIARGIGKAFVRDGMYSMHRGRRNTGNGAGPVIVRGIVFAAFLAGLMAIFVGLAIVAARADLDWRQTPPPAGTSRPSR
jgi:hypothetical protein